MGNAFEGSVSHPRRNPGIAEQLTRSLLIGLAMGVSMPALAMDVGRAHLASAPGQPLVVTIALRSLSAQDLESLSARVASEQQWTQAGLTPPVALSGLSVRIVDGPQRNSRVIEFRGSKAASSSVIDVLIDLSSATTSRLVQSSVITRSAPQVTLVGQTYEVMRGDTLIDIARQFPVQGATLYQTLWALYQANQRAFISENMNLLRAGVSLSIPSAASILAIEPAFARAQYLAHVRAFQGSRGRAGSSALPSQTNAATRAEQRTQSGAVEPAPESVAVSNASDKVRLSSVERNGKPANGTHASVSSSQALADQQTSQRLALQEEQSRRQELERNVEALKGALAATGAASTAGLQAGQTAGQASTSPERSSADSTTAASGLGASDPASGASRVGASAQGTEGQNTASRGAVLQSPASQGTDSQSNGMAGNGTAAAASANNGNAQPQASGVSAQSSGSTAGGAVGGAAGATNATDSVSVASAAQGTATQSSTAQATSSDSPVEQVKQWVSDNTLAAGALILALIALFFAWIMRSSAVREASSREARHPQAQAFERKLKDISLDLDDVPAETGEASAGKASSTSSVDSPSVDADKVVKPVSSANARSGKSGKSGKSGGGKA